MAGCSADSSLREIFDQAFLLHSEIEDDEEPSCSEKIKNKVGAAVDLFVHATQMVNSLGFFSSNEELEEVATSELRYLLLPTLLGDLFLRQTTQDRLTLLNISKVYFTDFLKRCKSYGLTELDVSRYTEDSRKSNSDTMGIHEMVNSRQEKIARYKEQREQERQLKELRKTLDVSTSSHDEETERKYYCLLLKVWINKAVDHLKSIHSEIEIIEHMDTLNNREEGDAQQPTTKDLKPVLITRDDIKKGIFGLGYPSIPTVSQEDYIEKEIRQGKVVLDYDNQQIQRSNPEKKCVDEDDPATLKKMRDWDDWKDDHRRGCGNRENMG